MASRRTRAIRAGDLVKLDVTFEKEWLHGRRGSHCAGRAGFRGGAATVACAERAFHKAMALRGQIIASTKLAGQSKGSSSKRFSGDS